MPDEMPQILARVHPPVRRLNTLLDLRCDQPMHQGQISRDCLAEALGDARAVIEIAQIWLAETDPQHPH
jgi:hypothetical protein